MKEIETLATIEGREALKKAYADFKFNKNIGSLSSLKLFFQICAYETELNRFFGEDIIAKKPLGFWRGTRVWLEEIVNRFYFSTINALVYFGAAVLLVIIGVRRFSDTLSDTSVIFGIAFEATMLIFMFLAMLFSPQEEGADEKEHMEREQEREDLIREIGEIAADFASASIRLEQISDGLIALTRKQDEILASSQSIADSNSKAVSPNPELLNSMDKTRESLDKFSSTIEKLNSSAEKLQREEIETAVRKELERILSEKAERRYARPKE